MYRLSDLLDLAVLQNMADAHYRAAGMPIGIIDAFDGSVLVGAGWQDICVEFHRAHPVALQRCHESDDYIKERLAEGEACQYKCKNGLWDIGMPITVGERHLATMFLGQFFYEGEVPDRDFFRQQAQEFGFDEDEYLAALDRVPVFDREKVDYILEYDKALTAFIADLAENALMQKEAQGRIRQQASFLQLLIDAMPYPVFYKDRQGRYLGCNREYEEFLGLDREQIKGNTVYEIATQEQADIHHRADSELLAHGGTQTYETPTITKDGLQRDLMLHKATFDGPDGTAAGIVGVIVDLTDRKTAEREKEELQSQLSLSQKMESIGRLAGGVAHDFNNMLNIIIGYAELALLELQADDPLCHDLNEIHAAAERSRDITRQLLTFARRDVTSPKVLDVNSTVENTLKIFRRLLGEDIELVWRPGTNLWPVLMDPSQLDQIVANLCVNARDAIADVGKILVETGTATLGSEYCSTHEGTRQGDYVWLSVGDTGCGMDRETVERVFEPFFTTKEKGTGLGLATVYGTVKQNNGSIDIISEPGRGTTFEIFLPRYEGEMPEEDGRAADEAPQGRGESVLVVEDETPILRLAELVLTKHNYRVLTASSPADALRLAQENPGGFALLVTDVVMPEMNGFELAKRLRSLLPKIKCLFMSGYAPDAIADRGVLGSDTPFIQKPWKPLDLARKVRETLDE